MIPRSGDPVNSLAPAHELADLGVPVFSARLDPAGQPDRTDRRWARWEKKQPSSGAIDRWRPGDAMCAVTGVVVDVIDWDPRNDPGGRSWAKMETALGDDGPEVLWSVATPRGGVHLYVAALGLGSHNGFLPGLDLKGGKADGSGPLGPVCMPLSRFVETCLEEASAPSSLNGHGPGRSAPSDLKRAVLAAPSGSQRTALLRYVHELERKGYERPDIVSLLKELLTEISNFDGRDPWYPARGSDPERHISSLFHRPGAVVGDARPGELVVGEPVRGGLMRSFEEIEQRRTQWIVREFLARGEMTVLDGEKGVGKSLLIEDVAARLSRGESLPGLDSSGEALHVAIFCSESSAETETGPRLSAAGAIVSRVHCPKVRQGKRGKAAEEWVLPDSAIKFAQAIQECDASLAIFDPINSFLAEDINTNNEASIRRALSPLGRVLRDAGCAGWLVRHLNKDTKADISMRGVGTTGYQNIARIHMGAQKLPPDTRAGQFGMYVISSNLRKVSGDVLAYDIINSEIEADDSDGMVPVIEWYGISPVRLEDLKAFSHARMGPAPMEQELIAEVLNSLFDEADTWPKERVIAELKAAGASTNEKTVAKARNALGIRPERVMRRGAAGGIESWVWTSKTWKGKVRARIRNEE